MAVQLIASFRWHLGSLRALQQTAQGRRTWNDSRTAPGTPKSHVTDSLMDHLPGFSTLREC